MDVYNKIKSDLTWLIVIVFAIQIIMNVFNIGHDSTDGDKRSGMELHTDNMTGCQYLSARGGGLIPRVDQEGNHVCLSR